MDDSASQSGPRGVLLVHGAWHDGSTWDGVAGGLRKAGVPVAVAELHRGSLASDIAAAEAALNRIIGSGPVIACGHSYGGAVITGLPPEKVAHLVYLAAPMPDIGESSLALLAGAPPSDLGACVLGDLEGVTTIDPTAAGELFHAHLSQEQRAVHVAALVPQSMSAGHEATTSAAWHTRPSTFVVCSDDRVVHPDLQRRLSKRATDTVTWDSDHGAPASREAETIELLKRLATTAPG
ncbi:pimeloyl-ACP methyl ester carboxylesterase [Streptomyces aurantiacus]|uniref:alpha/beta hydrolase n=1 Tax=Streptomyces aurantiacus TaxID=47760 RepID=UPI002790903A|nr:alpha/beta hydrolase [Streptomyces aurantiacus]MDQ0779736.1 pimeloyl-ACP methyl ester carboxylesterase [Streptomyces aurantiacus]